VCRRGKINKIHRCIVESSSMTSSASSYGLKFRVWILHVIHCTRPTKHFIFYVQTCSRFSPPDTHKHKALKSSYIRQIKYIYHSLHFSTTIVTHMSHDGSFGYYTRHGWAQSTTNTTILRSTISATELR
jgi:hypothetical protein